ncbi:MAG: DUF2283 domain-containing protein [Candidatus Bathyarchaeia archaeon]
MYGKNKVRAWYDKSVDIFYLLFKEGPSHEVIEADPDAHLELDENGKIMGIEIWNARKSGLIKQVAKAITEIAS